MVARCKKNIVIGSIVIITVLLVGLACMCFILYQDSNNAVNNDNPKEPTPSNISSNREFIIPELNVKFPELPNELSDLVYYVDTSALSGSVLYFNTKTLESMDGADSFCTTKNGPLGLIWIVDQDPATISNSGISTYKKIGSSYIVYQHPQSGCSTNLDTSNKQTLQAQLLQDLLSTVVSYK